MYMYTYYVHNFYLQRVGVLVMNREKLCTYKHIYYIYIKFLHATCRSVGDARQLTATHYNSLQHTCLQCVGALVVRCNALQHTALHCTAHTHTYLQRVEALVMRCGGRLN